MRQFDDKLTELESKYRKSSKPIAFEFRDFCSNWKWAKRSDVYTHYLHKYPAKLIPYIPIFFLSSSWCDDDEIVLDPFAGSGTVLLESIAHPLHKRNCYGVEINPLARLIAKVKTTVLDKEILNEGKASIFSALKKEKEAIIPEYKNLSMWFSRDASRKLGRLRKCIERLPEGNCKDFFLVCFSSIVRKVSLADPNIPPPVVLKPRKYRKSKDKAAEMRRFFKRNQRPNVFAVFKKAVEENAERVDRLSRIEETSDRSVNARIVWDDFRSPKIGELETRGMVRKEGARKFPNGSIGLIVTSPPYITAQKYVRTTKLELLWLGLVKAEQLILLDRATIGTETIRQSDSLEETGVKEIDLLCERVAKKSKVRAVMVSKYFADMKTCLSNAYRVLRKDGRMVLVVGDNEVCGRPVETHALLARLGEDAGFDCELIAKDEIRSRGMITKRQANGGLIEHEYAVVLKK